MESRPYAPGNSRWAPFLLALFEIFVKDAVLGIKYDYRQP